MSRPVAARSLAVIALAVLTVIGGLVPARAGMASKRYDLASFALVYSDADPTGNTLAADGSIDVGGVAFDAIGGTGTTTITFVAKDDVDPFGTGYVYISACQDLDADSSCDTSKGDIRAAGCTKPSNKASDKVRLDGAKKNAPIQVFVYAVYGCPGLLDVTDVIAGATTGTVTMTW